MGSYDQWRSLGRNQGGGNGLGGEKMSFGLVFCGLLGLIPINSRLFLLGLGGRRPRFAPMKLRQCVAEQHRTLKLHGIRSEKPTQFAIQISEHLFCKFSEQQIMEQCKITTLCHRTVRKTPRCLSLTLLSVLSLVTFRQRLASPPSLTCASTRSPP